MKFFILLLTFLTATICNAEIKVKIYFEQIADGYAIYMDNNEYCPVSIKMDFSTTNLEVVGGNNSVYLVEALAKKHLLTRLTISNKQKAYKFSYKYTSNYGNYKLETYDQDYEYYLPFQTSNTFKVYQGYNGTFSHQNKNSIDFTMPIGTEITAIREGIVINVVDKNSKGCAQEECKKYNNYITVYHSDGTFSEYSHLKQNGSKVEVGERVAKGQPIGYSGNVGWSTGPHLHLEVFKQKLSERQTLKTKFKVDNGDKTEYLVEKEDYSREY